MRAITNSLIAIVMFLSLGIAAISEESFIVVDAPRGSTALGMRASHPECQALSIPVYLEQFAGQNGIENSELGFRHIWPGQWKLPTALTPTVEAVVETAPAEIKRTNARVAVLEPVVVGHELALPTYYAFAPVRSSEVERIDSDELEARHEATAKQAELESLREKVDSLAETNNRLATEKTKALATAERLKQEQASRSQQVLSAPIEVESRVSNDSSPTKWLLIAALIGLSILLVLVLRLNIFLSRKTWKQSRELERQAAEIVSLEIEVEKKTTLADVWESRWQSERARVDLNSYPFRLEGMNPEVIRFEVDQIIVRGVPGCREPVPVEKLEYILRDLGPDRRKKMGILKFPDQTEATPEVTKFFRNQDQKPKALALV